MLNVSCQKQNHCSSFPADSLTKCPMECVGQPRLSMACNLLEVPGLSYSDFDGDEGEVVIGIRPRFSPQPRRKSSITDDDSEPDPPYCSSRRVSFADAKGLSLVQVKEFDTWAVPKLPGYDSSEGDGNEAKEYYLSPLTFSLPLPTEELLVKVRDQKVELESIELLPGTTILKGVIRVLNISFSKTVYVRTTLDAWSNHFDLLAEYNPGSSDGLMDCFSFMLTLVPPFGKQGVRVDFCLRYETPVGTFWANNNHRNYVLFCHQKMKDRPQKDNESKKGCLKAVSQIYSSEENISGSDASSQESISADELKLGEEVNSMKDRQSSDDRSKTTGEGEQKLETENRPFISRRSARKAARLARVRDHFAQRSKEGSDTEREETPPEVKQTAQEEKPQEEHSNVPPFSEENSKSEVSSFASNSMGVRKSLVDVPRDFLQASHNIASNEPEKCESNEMDDLATGGVSVTEIPDNPLRLNDQPTHAEWQNVTMSASRAEEESQMQNTCHGPVNNTAPDPGVTSSEISENPVGQNNRFTFGTVVAPLYHQMLGREGSERQSTADRGSPVRVTLSTGDWRKESCCTGSTGVGHDTVQGNVMNAQESNQSPSNVEEQRSDSVMAEDVLDPPAQIIQSDHRCTNTAEDPIVVSGDTEVHQHCGNLLSTDTLSAQIPPRRLHLRGKSQEDTKPCDFQNQTTTERKIETNINKTVLQTESQQVRPTIGPSFASSETHQETRSGGEYDCQCVNESNSEADIGKDDTESITNSSPKLDNLLEALYDLNSDQIHRSDFSTPGSCQETKNETSYVEEQNEMTNHEDESQNSAETEVSDEATCDDDMFVKLKDEDSLMDEPRSVFLKQEDITLADTTDVKKWEMMVDEEERTILLSHEEVEAMRSDTEADQGGQLEDTVIGTTLEKERGKTLGEVCEALTAAGVYDGTAEDAVMLEDKGRVEEEETLEAVAGIEYVQATQTVTTATGEEQQTGEDDQTSVQEVKKIVIEEEIKTREEKTGDEEIIGDEAGDSDDVNAESVGITTDDRGDEVRCFEASLDITQNNGEDALSPMMNSVQKKRVTGRKRERVNAHIPPEIDLYNKEDFQSSEHVRHDRSHGDLCSVTDEPESDQTNHNSASSESDSDDEVELYMHCLRAVHTGAQATKDNDTGFSAGKRGSMSRRKSLPTPMPSICESLDEEPHFGGFQDNHEDLNPAEFQPAPAAAAAAPSVSSGQESNSSDVSWWKETFSCSNVSKTLLYTTLLGAFLVVAYHYDFLACFVLYLISIVWLYCQREQQPSKNNSRME
ncbi:phosphatase 1 regulatory subunit 3A [Solea senegalensis]|uniref:Phosphatase 1 regulatory subunit 3A n=1 Tax=Solea senegalensis TaxID=28829 RepID=A0AAV6SYH0_SOLSE|nr:uncharacterized protein ppp1r3ab [Solea senegalensis]KAG7522347.1 phosphatase 1 regulatory subunit 3A [Solea senegalensis]